MCILNRYNYNSASSYLIAESLRLQIYYFKLTVTSVSLKMKSSFKIVGRT
jgi:hypothetical protein